MLARTLHRLPTDEARRGAQQHERDEARIVREVRYTARTPVPSYLRRLLPDGLGYVEHAQFDRKKQVLEHTIVPSTAAARTDIRASLRVEPTAQGQSRRIYEGTVAIELPLLGARLERNTVKNIATSQERAGLVTREWLARADAPTAPLPTAAQV